MSINISRYVNITSGVGAGTNVPTRNLGGRMFTGSPLLPPGQFVRFTTAAQVADFFGNSSEEATRASFYFSWTSKNITQADSIQFARWVNVAVAASIFSTRTNNTLLANWTGITDGSFGLTIGGVANVFSALDFSTDISLDAVAARLQTAIRAKTGIQWTAATVTYNQAGGFTFTSGSAIAADISVQPGIGGTDITGSGLLGWLPAAVFLNGVYSPGAIWSAGSLAQTITQTLSGSATTSNDFGSFLFLSNLGLTIADVTEAATWNFLQNNMFMYTVSVTAANAAAWSAALATIGGVGLTLDPPYAFNATGTVTSASNTITALSSIAGITIGTIVTGTSIPAGTTVTAVNATNKSVTVSALATGTLTQILTFLPAQYPEQIPMMVAAATDYTAPNSVQNYMFQTNFLGVVPSVNDDTLADFYDALSINYYGTTQTAGTVFNFYQRGVLLGPTSSPLDMNTYVNEIWLKDAATAALMTMFLALGQVAANIQGRSQILTSLQSVINSALNNGTISVNKTLTTSQRLFISQITNDPDAWYQVQSIGYWLDCEIVASATNPVVYTAEYTLVYSKDDVIRKVEGQHILI